MTEEGRAEDLAAPARHLPSGTVTFLFTDIQGSTRLAHDLGTDRWHEVLELTGAGGTGKTRLSLQLAAEIVEEFPHGVWFVRLAPVRQADLVPSAVAQALGVQVTGNATLGDKAYADALEGAGGLTYWLGDVEAAIRYYAEHLEIARRLQDRALLANSLYNFSFTHFVLAGEPDLVSARRTLEEALAIAREVGDPAAVANVLWGIAAVGTQGGDFPAAQPFYDEAIELYRQADDRFGLAWARRSSGLNLLKQGRIAEARQLVGEAIQLVVAAADQSGLGILLSDLAEVARAEGDPLQAQRLRGASAMMTAQTGAALVRVAELMDNRLAEFANDDERAAFEEGTQMTIEEAVAYALGRHGRTAGSPAFEVAPTVPTPNGPG